MTRLCCLTLLVALIGAELSQSASALPPVDRSAMATAFDQGVLPPPLPLPGGDMDAVCASLAKTIAAGKADAVPALETALLVAGFGIRGARGGSDTSILKTSTHSQGLVLDAWEIAAIAKSFAGHQGVGLQQLSDSLASGLPAFKPMTFAAGLIVAVRSNVNSQDPAPRTFAHLLLELGRQSEQPYDLLSDKLDPAQVRLDSIQTALILTRLAGDLAVQGARRPARTVSLRERPQPHLQSAAFHPTGSPNALAFEEGTPGPCTSKRELENLVGDGYSAIQSTFFGKFWEFVAEHVEALEDVEGSVATAAGTLVLLEKALNALTAIHVDIEMEGPIPLIRTPDSHPGQRRLLQATVRVDSGNWEALNCARYALQWLGLDPKTLHSGPLKTGVLWRMRRNSDPNGLPQVLVDFDDTTGRASTASHAADNPKTTTDEDGISRIFIVGHPQYTILTAAQLHPVSKSVTILVDVQPKHFFNETPEDRAAEAIDVGNIIFKGILVPTDAVIETAGETFLRSYLPSGQAVVPIQDWATHFYCGPNKQTYKTASACTNSCRVGLANFAGVCVPQ